MSEAASTTEILSTQRGPATALRFDERMAAPFIQKSLSHETRAAYRRGIRSFFGMVGWLHPTQITPEHVRRYRDKLIGDKRQPATIAAKLSVVRSLFAYLQAAGIVALNPASTKLVPPPALPTQHAGRALTPKEVRHCTSSDNLLNGAGKLSTRSRPQVTALQSFTSS